MHLLVGEELFNWKLANIISPQLFLFLDNLESSFEVPHLPLLEPSSFPTSITHFSLMEILGYPLQVHLFPYPSLFERVPDAFTLPTPLGFQLTTQFCFS